MNFLDHFADTSSNSGVCGNNLLQQQIIPGVTAPQKTTLGTSAPLAGPRRWFHEDPLSHTARGLGGGCRGARCPDPGPALRLMAATPGTPCPWGVHVETRGGRGWRRPFHWLACVSVSFLTVTLHGHQPPDLKAPTVSSTKGQGAGTGLGLGWVTGRVSLRPEQ